jgi:hypothetical protein
MAGLQCIQEMSPWCQTYHQLQKWTRRRLIKVNRLLLCGPKHNWKIKEEKWEGGGATCNRWQMKQSVHYGLFLKLWREIKQNFPITVWYMWTLLKNCMCPLSILYTKRMQIWGNVRCSDNQSIVNNHLSLIYCYSKKNYLQWTNIKCYSLSVYCTEYTLAYPSYFRYLAFDCTSSDLYYTCSTEIPILSKIIHKVCSMTWDVINLHCMSLPAQEDWPQIATQFEHANFPNCTGCIDS